MAKVKIPLEMADGTMVRDLDALREHFDPESVIAAFRKGTLLQWLDAHYFEEEAAAIRAIDKDAPDCQSHVFAALGIEYHENGDVDEDAAMRRKEKQAFLRQKTEDKSILANVDQTALDQEDLSDLINGGASVIYLVEGATFRIPLSKKNKSYVGILGIPKVQVSAKKAEELRANGITFENVALPAHLQSASRRPQGEISTCPHCGEEIRADAKECKICGQPISANAPTARYSAKSSSHSARPLHVTLEVLKDIYDFSFHPERQENHSAEIETERFKRTVELMGDFPNAQLGKVWALVQGFEDFVSKIAPGLQRQEGVWCIAGRGGLFPNRNPNMNAGIKEACLRRICQGRYAEDNLVHICVNESYTEGWAFTIDSFCCCEGGETLVIPYEDLRAVRILTSKDDYEKFYEGIDGKGGLRIVYDNHGTQKTKRLEGDTVARCFGQIAAYLTTVGNLYGHNLENKAALDDSAVDEILDNLAGAASFFVDALKMIRG